ncbi:MAG: hypothetical protein ACTTJ2_04230 [Anaerovoracaceae bacterium]
MANKLLQYKGFTGSAEFSPEDNMMHGEVLGVDARIEYEGQTEIELESDFRNGVDFYLANSEAENQEPHYFQI